MKKTFGLTYPHLVEKVKATVEMTEQEASLVSRGLIGEMVESETFVDEVNSQLEEVKKLLENRKNKKSTDGE